MTKIAKLIDAGHSLEKNKKGFTINELIAALKWNEDQKQYVQNIMVSLTKKGKAKKLNSSRPVIYTLQPSDAAAESKAVKPETDVKPYPASRTAAVSMKAPRPDPAPRKDSILTPDELLNMEIPLELIGEGVFRRSRELERRIFELETELVDTKRKLDEANRRIGEQVRMIEKQNQIIAGQNRDRKPAPMTARLKDVASITWKRRP